MKPLKKILLLCAASLLLFIPSVVNAAEEPTTSAALPVSITFEDGGLKWGDKTAMAIQFGTQEFPADDATFESSTGSHSIVVVDERETLSGWEVYVSMTSFTSSTYTFEGTIAFTNGTCTPNGSMTVTVSDQTVNQTASRIAYVSSEAVYRNSYTLAWDDTEQVMLALSKEEALKVTGTTYTATLTWELRTTP